MNELLKAQLRMQANAMASGMIGATIFNPPTISAKPTAAPTVETVDRLPRVIELEAEDEQPR